MKKFVLFLILLSGCNPFIKTWEEISIGYGYPSWTQDNKIVFLEEIGKYRYKKDIIEWWLERGGITVEPLWEEVWLWEVDTLQNYQRIGRVWRMEKPKRARWITNTSSSGEWVVIGVWNSSREDEFPEIWKIKRDGTGAKIIGSGVYPDLSPDGKKVVYQKKYWDKEKEEEVGQGIWIMNIDGTNDHQIVNDEEAMCPAWRSDGGRILYQANGKTYIVDTLGNLIDSLRKGLWGIDWGPADSNALTAWDYKIDKSIIVYLEPYREDTLQFLVHWWSPNGKYFIGGKTIYTRDGKELFKIKP